MITKRMFLIGAGSLISAPLIAKIMSHVRDTGEPFLIPPLKSEEQLHVYPDYSGETNQFRITLGPDQYDPPEDVPTWRQYFASKGRQIKTEADYAALWQETWLSREEVDDASGTNTSRVRRCFSRT